MYQIARKPYIKQYNFPIISDASIFQCILYVLAIVLPFFMVFSVRNFYLGFVDEIQVSPTIAYNYSYFIEIETNKQTKIFTNFYQQTSKSVGITLDYIFDAKMGSHQLQLNYPKNMQEKVKRVNILLGFAYSNEDYSDAFGLFYGSAQGNNLADIAITGFLQIKSGANPEAAPPQSNILTQYKYDVAQAFIAFQNNYATYLHSDFQYLATNMPNNQLTISCVLGNVIYHVKKSNATVIGQLTWSFVQYFAVAFIFWQIATAILSLMFRQSILRSTIKHEKRMIF